MRRLSSVVVVDLVDAALLAGSIETEGEAGALEPVPMCDDCPIGGRDGSGPVCPRVAACDSTAAGLVAAHDVRCGLRPDLAILEGE